LEDAGAAFASVVVFFSFIFGGRRPER
jgi:hypothetical protein